MRDVTPETMQRATPGPPILLVEDDRSQALLIKRVLGKAGLVNTVHAFTDGGEALSHVRRLGPNSAELPALVLLDLHTPGESGLEVLAWLRQQPSFHEVPVIMLSGSTESEDIDRAFELGADSYLVKPVAFDALVDAVTSLGLPWMILDRRAVPAR
jgi:CheY-like chemotaxis protein